MAISKLPNVPLEEYAVRRSNFWGIKVNDLSIQIAPPSGAPARLFVRDENNGWYYIDLPYKV